jgi:hypothetical protein
MNTTLKAGILLGVLVSAWTYLMGITGWYKSPALMNLFWFVILIQIGVLVWGLRLTAAEGRNYWGQVKTGTFISLIGGMMIFCGSYVFTSVVFPNYFVEIRALGEEMLRSKGMSNLEIKAALDGQAPMQTSFMQALFGFIGTVVTGPVVSLMLGLFLKKKEA